MIEFLDRDGRPAATCPECGSIMLLHCVNCQALGGAPHFVRIVADLGNAPHVKDSELFAVLTPMQKEAAARLARAVAAVSKAQEAWMTADPFSSCKFDEVWQALETALVECEAAQAEVLVYWK